MLFCNHSLSYFDIFCNLITNHLSFVCLCKIQTHLSILYTSNTLSYMPPRKDNRQLPLTSFCLKKAVSVLPLDDPPAFAGGQGFEPWFPTFWSRRQASNPQPIDYTWSWIRDSNPCGYFSDGLQNHCFRPLSQPSFLKTFSIMVSISSFPSALTHISSLVGW